MGFHFYADDIQLYLSFNSLGGDDQACSVARVEFCVREIDNWMTRNKLKLNRDKTQLLVVSSIYLPRPSLDSIVVGDYRVCSSITARNIGVVFDQTLSREKHVISVCKSALFCLRNIAKIREYLTVESTKILFHAFVICRLDNCNSLLVCSPKYLIQKLQRIQDCAARLAQLPRAARASPVLQELHCLPVDERIIFKVLLITYKALNNLGPVFISNLLVRYEPSRNLRSTDKYLLQIPKTRLKTYGDRAFSVSAPRLWNVLPMEIKLSPSDSVFKNRLKTHLFRATYN